MCECNIIDAEISRDEIILTCECGEPSLDEESRNTLEAVALYLRTVR